MKERISLFLATIALFAPSLSLRTKAATQIYDLKSQWSATANPNGTWSFRQGDCPLINSPFPWVGTDYANVYSGPFYIIPPSVPVITKFNETFSVPYYEFGLELGDIFVTPGNGGNILWTAPESGKINVSGTAWSVDFICWANISWTLEDEGALLSGGEFSSPGCEENPSYTRNSPYDLSLGSGGAAALQNISVEAGDQLVLAFGGSSIGLNFTITLTTDSLDPVAAVEALAAAVIEMNLHNGIENSLDSKLDTALAALADANLSNDGAACNSLNSFINAVEAQRGNKITTAQADQLITSAQEIKTLLNCGN